MAETPNPDIKGEGDQADRMVPLSAVAELRQEVAALKAAKAESDRQAAELRGRLDGLSKPETKKAYTTAELATLVREGKMTESQAVTIRDRQNEERINQRIDSAVSQAIDSANRSTSVTSVLNRYKAVMPEIDVPGTPERQKAEREFARLLELGLQDNLTTNLLAIEKAFGSIEALEAAKETGTRGESHQETSGGGGSSKPSSSGWPKNMPAQNREHYDRLISRGVYTREQAIEEWKHARAA